MKKNNLKTENNIQSKHLDKTLLSKFGKNFNIIEERINIEEKVAGLKAKIQNIAKYINTSKKRLQRLEKRYKDTGQSKGKTGKSSSSNTQKTEFSSKASVSSQNTRKADDVDTVKTQNQDKMSQTKQIKNLSNRDALQKLKVDEELDKLKKKMGLK